MIANSPAPVGSETTHSQRIRHVLRLRLTGAGWFCVSTHDCGRSSPYFIDQIINSGWIRTLGLTSRTPGRWTPTSAGRSRLPIDSAEESRAVARRRRSATCRPVVGATENSTACGASGHDCKQRLHGRKNQNLPRPTSK